MAISKQTNTSYFGRLSMAAENYLVSIFQLDELKAYQATGSLPHAFNTALKADRIHTFLRAFPAIRREMPRHTADTKEAHTAAEAATTQILVQ